MNEKNKNNPTRQTDTNADPITGAHGAHPVGTSLGAIGIGAAAGAAWGAIAGPVGAAVGAVAGAVVGGLAGKAAAEVVDPTVEGKYWSENYAARPYADPKVAYDQYAPAYRYGWESYGTRGGTNGQTFESVEGDLRRGWEQAKGASHLGWDKAMTASRDAWNRVKDTASAATARSGC
jgi:hypothetical protein